MRYNTKLQEISRFMKSGKTKLDWGDTIHISELGDNYKLWQNMLSDETTYLSLLQEEKLKKIIIVATLNLGAQLRNGCAKGYLKLSNLEYMSVYRCI